MVSFGNDELKPHFIYCGHYYQSMDRHLENFRKIFLKNMKKFEIQSSMLTIFRMERICLITEETAKAASEGKMYGAYEWTVYDEEQRSFNDDFEKLLLNCQYEYKPRSKGKRIEEVNRYSFFTQKLTEEELKLVEDKNEDHLKTYKDYPDYNPDVNDEWKKSLDRILDRKHDNDVEEIWREEMKKSDSKSKYVHARCRRLTYSLMLRRKYGIAIMAWKNCCKLLSWRVWQNIMYKCTH